MIRKLALKPLKKVDFSFYIVLFLVPLSKTTMTLVGQASREKGSTFFKLGNFEGAMNAFSEALEYDSQDIKYALSRISLVNATPY